MELDAGLDPRTLGSHPDPKADAQPLSHPGVPFLHILFHLAFVARGILTLDIEPFLTCGL